VNVGTLALAAAGGALAGSIPFGVVASRLIFKSDIRTVGSGNIGAANALRTYGGGFGATILVLDALKGAVPTLLARDLGGPGYGLALAAGTGAVLGHCFTPWLGFRGGKGVATLLGVLFALSPSAGLTFVLVWLAAVVPTRYSSLGSLLATALAPFCVYLATRDGAAAAGLAVAALVVFYQHRENIVRLRQGKENKISLRRRAA
jgi:acyl phosphate:glycerol-3-phosphate acyltransferase